MYSLSACWRDFQSHKTNNTVSFLHETGMVITYQGDGLQLQRDVCHSAEVREGTGLQKIRLQAAEKERITHRKNRRI